MKVLLEFVILIHVSQHALAVLVEVYEGAESVQLPCQVSFVLEDTTVMWDRYDLDPKTVHRWYEGRDELDDQNQRYRGRTSMATDGAEPGDLSLTLRKPQLSDSGNYVCIISKFRDEERVTDIQLKVKVSKVEVEVKDGSESVQLPCQTPPPLPEDTTVEWSRSDPKPMIVHVYPNSSDLLKKQDEFFCSRTKIMEDLLKTGDISLTLKNPTERDSGAYICTVNRDGDVLRQKVVLHHVREYLSTRAKVLLVLLAVGLVAGGGFAIYLWYYFTTVSKVEVIAGAESVLLPFKTTPNLPQDITVEWKRFGLKPTIVHVSQNGTDQPDKQNQVYHERTKMTEDLLQTGDLSLTLKYPKDPDSGFYICTVSTHRHVLQKKQLRLQVRVPQVEVVEGVESVVLPCKNMVHPPNDATVEWSRSEPWPMIVHVYQNGSDHPEKQNWIYRNRTEMKEDQVKNKDLSLTLKDPTLFDTGTYICTVSKDGHVLKKKNIRLQVKETNQDPDDEKVTGVTSSTPLMADIRMESV